MSQEQLRLVKEYLQENLKKGFIVPSNAPFASPVLFVPKPGGRGLRFCVDYRALNAATKKDKYPLPLIEETMQKLASAKIFTKLDVRHAFNRIRLANEAVEDQTTFNTRFGAYKYKVLPFGLCNGPATFQRYINSVLFDYLDQFCTAYIDDILIYSADELEHVSHVNMVLARLKDAGLQVDIKKSEFQVKRTKFLGFIITTEGLEMDPEKVATIRDWPVPRSVKALQSFLGFCNFYRKFLHKYGRYARPLQRLTAKGAWKPLEPQHVEAFETLKKLALEGGLMAHWNPEYETRMETDCSDGVAGGQLLQLQPNEVWRPVAFFSSTLNPSEMNYDIHDKEMLAIVKGLREWRGLLMGVQKPFLAITDHRALEYFTTKRQLTRRQARWAKLISEYDFKITYRPGK